jgi:hypothetical protein
MKLRNLIKNFMKYISIITRHIQQWEGIQYKN